MAHWSHGFRTHRRHRCRDRRRRRMCRSRGRHERRSGRQAARPPGSGPASGARRPRLEHPGPAAYDGAAEHRAPDEFAPGHTARDAIAPIASGRAGQFAGYDTDTDTGHEAVAHAYSGAPGPTRPPLRRRRLPRQPQRTRRPRPARKPPAKPTATHVKHPSAQATPRRGHRLPLHFRTGKATRVITVVAQSTRSTTARLQAWNKAPGGGWLKTGKSVTAHVGADGLSTSPSEYKSATPIGSFTLTRAFGHDSNPGTSLPYLQDHSGRLVDQPGRPALQHPPALLVQLPVHPGLAQRAPVLRNAVLQLRRGDQLQRPPGAAGCRQRVLPARHRPPSDRRLRGHPVRKADPADALAQAQRASAHPHRCALTARDTLDGCPPARSSPCWAAPWSLPACTLAPALLDRPTSARPKPAPSVSSVHATALHPNFERRVAAHVGDAEPGRPAPRSTRRASRPRRRNCR